MSELNDDQRLADALEELKEHNFMKSTSPQILYYNLWGLAIGLGSVVGATLLVIFSYKFLLK